MNEWEQRVDEALTSTDLETRVEGAKWLLPLTERAPDASMAILAGALLAEENPVVLVHLLRCCIAAHDRGGDVWPALRDSSALDTSGLPSHSGLAFPMIARLVIDGHMAALAHLPTDLWADGGGVWDALLCDAWVSAWWGISAAHPTDARKALVSLGSVPREDIPPEFLAFALRGVAISRLATAWDRTPPPPLTAEGEPREVLYDVDTCPAVLFCLSDFIRKNRGELGQAGADFIKAITESICCAAKNRVHPIVRDLANWQYHCSSECVSELAECATVLPQPAEALRSLPTDWEGTMAARILLDNGAVDDGVITYARSACEALAHGGTANGMHERGPCLAALGRLDSDPVSFYRAYRNGNPPGGLRAVTTAHVLAALTDAHPPLTASLLQQQLQSAHDIPAFREWCYLTRRWVGALLGEVFHVGFTEAPLDSLQARDYCQMMTDAARAMDPGPLGANWLNVYTALLERLSGCACRTDVQPTGSQLLDNAYAAIADMLDAHTSATPVDDVVDWVGQEYAIHLECPGEGLSAQHTHQIQSGLGRHPLTFIFPAARIAAVAVNEGRADPVARWHGLRHKVTDVLGEHSLAIQHPQSVGEPGLRNALSALLTLLPDAWWDCRLLNAAAALALYAGDPAQALDVMRHADKLLHVPQHHGSSLEYNTACAFALLEQPDETELHLRQAVELGYSNHRWLQDDPDFAQYREAPWFLDIVQQLAGPSDP